MLTVHRYLSDDHARLDELLARAVANPAAIDDIAFRDFRGGLLRHIAMEEKVLFAVARAQQHDAALQRVVRVLHADHAAIASILVPPPTHALIGTLRQLLEEHNPLEDAPGGLYERCDQLAGDDLSSVVARMQAIPPVRAAAHLDEPRIHEHIARMLVARQQVRAAP